MAVLQTLASKVSQLLKSQFLYVLSSRLIKCCSAVTDFEEALKCRRIFGPHAHAVLIYSVFWDMQTAISKQASYSAFTNRSSQSSGRAATQTGEYRRHWLCHLLASFLLLPLISNASKRFSCNLSFQIHLFPVVLHPLCKFSPKDSHLELFPGMFAKLRKTTVKYVMSVCPSVRPSRYLSVPMEQLVSLWTNFNKLYWRTSRKSAEKIQFPLKSDKLDG